MSEVLTRTLLLWLSWKAKFPSIGLSLVSQCHFHPHISQSLLSLGYSHPVNVQLSPQPRFRDTWPPSSSQYFVDVCYFSDLLTAFIITESMDLGNPFISEWKNCRPEKLSANWIFSCFMFYKHLTLPISKCFHYFILFDPHSNLIRWV